MGLDLLIFADHVTDSPVITLRVSDVLDTHGEFECAEYPRDVFDWLGTYRRLRLVSRDRTAETVALVTRLSLRVTSAADPDLGWTVELRFTRRR